MEKKILVVVDDSIYSRRAVEYAVLIDKLIKNNHYILFNVQPTISEYLIRDAHFDKNARLALSEVMERNKKESQRILDDFKEVMIGKGIEEGRIITVTQPRIMDVAKDVLNFAKQNACDAVLIGKRGGFKAGRNVYS